MNLKWTLRNARAESGVVTSARQAGDGPIPGFHRAKPVRLELEDLVARDAAVVLRASPRTARLDAPTPSGPAHEYGGPSGPGATGQIDRHAGHGTPGGPVLRNEQRIGRAQA